MLEDVCQAGGEGYVASETFDNDSDDVCHLFSDLAAHKRHSSTAETTMNHADTGCELTIQAKLVQSESAACQPVLA